MIKVLLAFSAAIAIAAHSEIVTLVIILAWIIVFVAALCRDAAKPCRRMWWQE